jgi:hypothetical protein
VGTIYLLPTTLLLTSPDLQQAPHIRDNLTNCLPKNSLAVAAGIGRGLLHCHWLSITSCYSRQAGQRTGDPNPSSHVLLLSLLHKLCCQGCVCLGLCDYEWLQCICCLLNHVWGAVAQKHAPVCGWSMKGKMGYLIEMSAAVKCKAAACYVTGFVTIPQKQLHEVCADSAAW